MYPTELRYDDWLIDFVVFDYYRVFILALNFNRIFCVLQVDLSTMLEEAVSYVKFLQHQIKVIWKLELFRIWEWFWYSYVILTEIRVNVAALDLGWLVYVCSACIHWYGYWTWCTAQLLALLIFNFFDGFVVCLFIKFVHFVKENIGLSKFNLSFQI